MLHDTLNKIQGLSFTFIKNVKLNNLYGRYSINIRVPSRVNTLRYQIDIFGTHFWNYITYRITSINLCN